MSTIWQHWFGHVLVILAFLDFLVHWKSILEKHCAWRCDCVLLTGWCAAAVVLWVGMFWNVLLDRSFPNQRICVLWFHEYDGNGVICHDQCLHSPRLHDSWWSLTLASRRFHHVHLRASMANPFLLCYGAVGECGGCAGLKDDISGEYL